MDHGVCNHRRLQALTPPVLGWWRAARGSTAQLLRVGHPPAKWVFLALSPETKTMLNMLAPQVNHLRGCQGSGYTPDGCLYSIQNSSRQDWTWEMCQMRKQTDIHRNYLKGSYRKGGVRLFSGKGWGWTNTYSTRNISITYKENIPQWGWPTTWTRAQTSYGFSILGGTENTARQDPEQNWDNSRADPAFGRGMVPWSPYVPTDLHYSMSLKDT